MEHSAMVTLNNARCVSDDICDPEHKCQQTQSLDFGAAHALFHLNSFQNVHFSSLQLTTGTFATFSFSLEEIFFLLRSILIINTSDHYIMQFLTHVARIFY